MLIQLTPAQLATMSTDIVVGQVTRTQSDWNTAHTHIHTLVTLTISQRVKGSGTASEVIIDAPGGTVGSLTEAVSDSAAFATGEKVFVFLQSQGSTFTVAGGTQGKFLIDSNNRISGSNISLTDFINQLNSGGGEWRGVFTPPAR